MAAVVCAAEFSWPCAEALATIWCESRYQADAYNPAGPYIGWWQNLNGSSDPHANTVEAHIKYVAWKRGQVADPWPNCP